jgi:hypothetical protein
MNIETDKLIIGGGPAGLFAAKNFLRRSVNDFLLLEQHPNSLGGLASQGWMKIGLFPAGKSTAELLGKDNYQKYTELFLDEYKNILVEIKREKFSSSGLLNIFKRKYYKSFLLSITNFGKIVTSIKNNIDSRLIYGLATSITQEGSEYIVKLKDNNAIRCNKIIIATGRINNLSDSLIKMGEFFSSNNEIYFGCRACFKTKNSENLYLDQPDFRIKNHHGFRTYCFNYNGVIKELTFGDSKYYSGTLMPESDEGNVFIGKKDRFTAHEVLNLRGVVERNKDGVFIDGFMGAKHGPYFYDLTNFVKEIENSCQLEFTKLLFPAVEQFWPRPGLVQNSLKSNILNNLYYIGDSSGVSFGVLQSFATASFVTDMVVNETKNTTMNFGN